jgi:hypothetical protein
MTVGSFHMVELVYAVHHAIASYRSSAVEDMHFMNDLVADAACGMWPGWR